MPMEKLRRANTYLLALTLLVAAILSGCGATSTPTAIPPSPTATPTPIPSPEDVIYLAIIWHQHQPVYYKDPATGVYAKPWVRVHAAKDYYDMAAILQDYPDVHVTFNLTPSLIRQLDDFAAGATDMYWEMTMVPADRLTDEQKWFILRYFFDINPKIIDRFPRYVELREMRPGASDADIQQAMEVWTPQDYRDLQVLFNLGWTDPDFLAQEPLASLVAKGRDFTEEDKATVLNEHLRILKEVIPLHRQMQESGQIEVTMTPFAHPILPLLIDTSLAAQAMPDAELPSPAFRFGKDAVAQVELGVQYYRDHFGTDPRGMWPAEGAVAQAMVGLVGRAGLRWMASDELVLAHSLGMDGFTRDSQDVVQEADLLYRPYWVQETGGMEAPPVAILFRDHVLSDRVSFTYSGMDGEAAAQDFVDRVHAIHRQLQEQGAEGPHLVTVILDGENAWEYYDNDGKAFLHTLYRLLSEDPTIVTVTPSEYLDQFPPEETIEDLWAGSWVDGTFSTWIGEEEENKAWEYLYQVRDILFKYEAGYKEIDPERLDAAREMMYIAEGSDWFWWYGADQDSGQDETFDLQFRETLKEVCRRLGEEPPAFLDVPVIPQRAQPPTQPATDLVSPAVDGAAGEEEWAAGGYYDATTSDAFERLYYGFDGQALYLRLDGRQNWETLLATDSGPAYLGFYLSVPGDWPSNPFSRWGGRQTVLGFGATHLLEVGLSSAALYIADGEGGWVPVDQPPGPTVAFSGRTLEAAVPFTPLNPELDTGDRLSLRAVLSAGPEGAVEDLALMPEGGPAQLVVPDLGRTTIVLEVADPEGDDHGPGSYTYPTDSVFRAGVFDLTGFSVGYDEQSVVFKFTVRGPVDNPWGSPTGLSLQAFDVYIDQDGPASGARLLLPGRNAALTADYAWDWALWINGWTPTLYRVGPDGEPEEVRAEIRVLPDPGQRKVTVKVPRSVLGDDPASWQFLALLLSHDGYGPYSLREIEPEPSQWQCGGRPDATNYPRIFDVAWPADGTPSQEAMLSDYPPSQEPAEELGPDDFAQLRMLRP
ncbi:MAG TPA: glycoside hydrolase [Chloroflexi bacterium]|nr:glycoside hydrolase [Chloroflexota bacterium]